MSDAQPPNPPRRLEGRVAIVTGAGRGIGESIAKVFAENGAKVLVVTRTEKYGQETVDQIVKNGGCAELLAIELGDRQTCSAIVDRAVSLWGGVDILIHNAAYVPHDLLVETADSEFAKAMDVGVNSAFWLIKDAYPHLKASQYGRVILTSSLSADRNHLKGLAPYSVTKNGINALARGAAVELGADGITVNAVAPGGTLSATFSAALSPEYIKNWETKIPMRRVGHGDDIARAMLFLASDDAAYVTGEILTVDGGQSLGQDMSFDDKPFGAP